MLDRADLIVSSIDHESGGAYQTIQYAKKQNKKIINLATEENVNSDVLVKICSALKYEFSDIAEIVPEKVL